MKQWQPFTDNELTKDVSENRCGGRRNIFFLLLFTDQLSTEYLETTLNENENEIKLSTLAVKQTLQVRGEKGLNRLMIFKINLKVIAEQKNYYNGFTLAHLFHKPKVYTSFNGKFLVSTWCRLDTFYSMKNGIELKVQCLVALERDVHEA